MGLEIRFAQYEWTPDGEVQTVEAICPPMRLLDYEPRSARKRISSTGGTLPGARPVGHTVDNVEEVIEVVAYQDAPDWLRTLNGWLEKALAWAESFRQDMRVVIQVRDVARHGASWYEAPLYGGHVRFRSSQGRRMQVQIERGPYWMGAESLCQVMNDGTSWAWADIATIYNSDDAQPGHNNWLLVYAPEGDVPTPARLRITNTYDVEARLKQIYLGWSDRPQALTLEGEEATGWSNIETGLEYSNGARAVGDLFKWEVANSGLVDYVGMFKVLANGSLGVGNWRLKLGYELTDLQTLRWVVGQNGWTDLGNVVLPPGMYSHPVRWPMLVQLDGTAEGRLDFILFMPVGHFQNRQLNFLGYNAMPGTCVEDDGWREELIYQFGGLRLPMLEAWGRPIMLWPDGMLPQALPGPTPPNAQMLSFALEGQTGQAEAQRTAQVQVYARPMYDVLP